MRDIDREGDNNQADVICRREKRGVVRALCCLQQVAKEMHVVRAGVADHQLPHAPCCPRIGGEFDLTALRRIPRGLRQKFTYCLSGPG